jgi:hypothetical protein
MHDVGDVQHCEWRVGETVPHPRLFPVGVVIGGSSARIGSSSKYLSSSVLLLVRRSSVTF